MMHIPPQHPSPEQLSQLTEFFHSEKLSEKLSEKQKSTTWPLLQSDADTSHLPMETRNESSHSASRQLPVLRPQQRTQLQTNESPRKMARTKSPSQKIPRNNLHPTQNQNIPSDQQLFETDENGNPKICFSYRTMEKQYEKDTLRMLERIQKSRSFEQQQGDRNNNNPSMDQRSSSLTEFGAANHETCQYYQPHYDSGFYIGDDSCENDYSDYSDHYQDQLEDEQDLFEEQEEIFELDL